MRRDKPSRPKPAIKRKHIATFVPSRQFGYDAREAARGRHMRKGDLPANPYEVAAEGRS